MTPSRCSRRGSSRRTSPRTTSRRSPSAIHPSAARGTAPHGPNGATSSTPSSPSSTPTSPADHRTCERVSSLSYAVVQPEAAATRSERSSSTGSPRRWRRRCSRPAIGVRFCGARGSLCGLAGEAGQARRHDVGAVDGVVDRPDRRQLAAHDARQRVAARPGQAQVPAPPRPGARSPISTSGVRSPSPRRPSTPTDLVGQVLHVLGLDVADAARVVASAQRAVEHDELARRGRSPTTAARAPSSGRGSRGRRRPGRRRPSARAS